MNNLRKIVSMILVLIMVASCVGFVPTSAVENDDVLVTNVNGTISIEVECLYSEAFDVMKITNEYRKSKGLHELKMDPSLLETAMLRAAELVLYYSHTRPDDNICFTANEYIYAENIAMLQIDAQDAFDSWEKSPGHAGNMSLRNVDSIGVGAVEYNGRRYWVQLFGTTEDVIVETPDECNRTYDIKLGPYTYELEPLHPDGVYVGDVFSVDFMGTNRGNTNAHFYVKSSNFEWSSSNDEVICASGDELYALSPGEATVTAIGPTGTYSKKYVVKPFSEGSSNKCGDNITWSYENNTLTLTGTGEMYDYSLDNTTSKTTVPWYNAFTHVKRIVVGEGITGIGDYAFFRFQKLESVSLPSSLKSIGDRSFMFSTLKYIDFPDNLETIGEEAFCMCESLTDFTFPDSVTAVGTEAFNNCISLRNVTIPATVTDWGAYVFERCSVLRKVTIEEGATRIGIGMFSDCRRLETISIPQSVTEIGSSAFYNCRSLQQIKLPDDLKVLGAGAFSSCNTLKEIVIPSKVEMLYGGAFTYCNELSSVTVLNPLTKFSENGNSDIKTHGIKVYCIKNSLAHIACEQNGYDYELLDAEEIMATAKGYTCEFDQKTHAHPIEINIESTPDEYDVLYSAGEVFNIHKSFSSIEEMANYYHTTPSSADRNTGYMGVTGTYPVSYFIYSDNMAPATGVVNVVIEKHKPAYRFPDSEITIYWNEPTDSNAYGNILLDVSEAVSAYVNVISDNEDVIWLNGRTFLRIAGYGECVLTAFNEADDFREAYSTSVKVTVCPVGDFKVGDFTVNISKDGVASIKKYFGYSKSPEIPTSIYDIPITEIRESAFAASSIESVIIPEGIEMICSGAFSNCRSLKEISLPDTLSTIDETAFRYCRSLRTIDIPSSVSSIGYAAFMDCDSMKSVIIPQTVTNIGDYAFGFEEPWDVKENFVIFGFDNSEAQIYANNNNITFISSADPVNPVFPPNPNSYTVYFINSVGWNQVAAFAWSDNAGVGMETDWPGVQMTKTDLSYDGFDVYKVSFDVYYENIIFNNNDSSNEVFTDILVMTKNHYYDPTKGIWIETLIPPTEPEKPTDPEVTIPTVDETDPNPTEKPSEPDTPEETYVLGDANNDGIVNIKDATLIQKHIAGLDTITGIGLSAADADGSVSVNIKDATAIQKFIAGLFTGYEIGNKFLVE